MGVEVESMALGGVAVVEAAYKRYLQDLHKAVDPEEVGQRQEAFRKAIINNPKIDKDHLVGFITSEAFAAKRIMNALSPGNWVNYRILIYD